MTPISLSHQRTDKDCMAAGLSAASIKHLKQIGNSALRFHKSSTLAVASKGGMLSLSNATSPQSWTTLCNFAVQLSISRSGRCRQSPEALLLRSMLRRSSLCCPMCTQSATRPSTMHPWRWESCSLDRSSPGSCPLASAPRTGSRGAARPWMTR